MDYKIYAKRVSGILVILFLISNTCILSASAEKIATDLDPSKNYSFEELKTLVSSEPQFYTATMFPINVETSPLNLDQLKSLLSLKSKKIGISLVVHGNRFTVDQLAELINQGASVAIYLASVDYSFEELVRLAKLDAGVRLSFHAEGKKPKKISVDQLRALMENTKAYVLF